MPSEHATMMGGSNAHRRIMCLGSYNAEKDIPDGPVSFAASEGTLCHTIVEKVLTGEVDEPDVFLDKEMKVDDHVIKVDGVLLNEKVDPALQAWDEISARYPASGDILVEPRVKYTDGVWGSSDVVWRDSEGCLNVLDWKFGRYYVSEVDSYQLQFYAGATLVGPTDLEELAAIRKGVRSVRSIIVQPLTRPVWRTDEVDVHRITRFADLVFSTIPAMQEKDAPRRAGSWCKWCKARPTCQAFQEQFQGPIDTSPEWGKVSGAELAALKPKRDAAEAFVKAFDEFELKALRAGVEVPRRKLTRGNGRWTWNDGAEEALRKMGLRVKDIMTDVKLRSFSAMQAKFRKRRDVLDLLPQIAVKSEGGLTVVDDNDPRPAAMPDVATREDAAEAAQSMERFLGK